MIGVTEKFNQKVQFFKDSIFGVGSFNHLLSYSEWHFLRLRTERCLDHLAEEVSGIEYFQQCQTAGFPKMGDELSCLLGVINDSIGDDRNHQDVFFLIIT
jgi:hypothetical protein